MTEQAFQFKDDQATKYAEWSSTSFGWLYIEAPSFDSHLQSLYEENPLTLDVGCGNGRVVEHLINKGISPSHIFALDTSRELLDVARKRLPNVNFVNADICHPPYRSESFDLVTANMTLDHLDDNQLSEALNSLRKVLKVGGELFYIVSHPLRVVFRDLNNYHNSGWRTEPSPWGTDVTIFYRPVSSYINATVEAGFEIATVDEPSVVEAGKVDESKYKNYSMCPPRLAVLARK